MRADHGDHFDEPNHFEFEFNAESQELKFDVWYCDSQDAKFNDCLQQDSHGCSDVHSGEIQADFNRNWIPICFLALINV